MATVVKSMLLVNGAHLLVVLDLGGVLIGVLLKVTPLMDRQRPCVRSVDAEVSYLTIYLHLT